LAKSKTCQLIIQGGPDLTNDFLVNYMWFFILIIIIIVNFQLKLFYAECNEWDI
jgi:hypothetical protein